MMQIISFRRASMRAVAPRKADEALTAFTALARDVRRRFRASWQRHRDEKLLQGLSDHQLRDLGIARGEISRVVRHGRGW